MTEDILNQIRQDPQAQQLIQPVVQDLLQDPDVTPESVAQLIKMFEFVLRDPNSYADFRQSAIQSGVLDEEDLPPQFEPTVLMAILISLQLVQEQMQSAPQQAFAQGGLAQLAHRGRNGDTQLAHINPFEARLLQSYGGSGRINPLTGMPEYGLFKKLKKVFKKLGPIVPLALNFIAPGLGSAIGGALSAALPAGLLSATAANALGSAVVGGLGSKLAGGSGTKGALLGALTAGLGGTLGSSANEALGLGLGKAGQGILGGGLAGAVGGAVGGGGLKAALTGGLGGALGTYAGQQVQGLGGTGSMGQGVNTAGTTFGNMMSSGYTPTQSLMGASLAGLTDAMTTKPSTAALASKTPVDPFSVKVPEGLSGDLTNVSKNYLTGGVDITPGTAPTLSSSTPFSGVQATTPIGYEGNPASLTEAAIYNPATDTLNPQSPEWTGGVKAPTTAPLPTIESLMPSGSGTGAETGGSSWLPKLNASNLLAGAALLGAVGQQQQPQVAQQAVAQLSPSQQEYFNRPGIGWDWDRINAAATGAGQTVSEFIARNWPEFTGGAYNQPQVAKARGGVIGYAAGGGLSQVARMARGAGSGRADTIDAKLSDGEYVMDAETVALLGDGSTKEGARRLDQMREKLRAHKGKTLARGKFSPSAKSPLAYLKEVA
jgi:hypothetical protein